MAHYAAFDVSDKETAVHVLDEQGRLVWKGKRPSELEALAAALRRHAPELVRVGLETGQLAPWLYHALKAPAVPSCSLRSTDRTDPGWPTTFGSSRRWMMRRCLRCPTMGSG